MKAPWQIEREALEKTIALANFHLAQLKTDLTKTGWSIEQVCALAVKVESEETKRALWLLSIDEDAGIAGYGIRQLRELSKLQIRKCGEHAAARIHRKTERELLGMDLKQHTQYRKQCARGAK